MRLHRFRICLYITHLYKDSAAVSSIEDMMKDNETLDAQQDNAGQQAVIWLYGSVHMMGKLADALES